MVTLRVNRFILRHNGVDYGNDCEAGNLIQMSKEKAEQYMDKYGSAFSIIENTAVTVPVAETVTSADEAVEEEVFELPEVDMESTVKPKKARKG